MATAAPLAHAQWPVRGIAVIAPVQPIPVKPVAPLAMQVETPSLAQQCALLQDEGGVSGLSLDMSDPWDKLLVENCAKLDDGWLTASQAPAPVYVFGLQVAPRPAVQAMATAAYTPARSKPILRRLPSLDGTVYTARNIIRRQADGPSVAIGSVLTRAPAWGDATRIGGVQLSRWQESPNGVMPEGELGYSSVVGVLDYTDVNATSGNYQLGETVGSSSVRYGVTEDFTLESHMEAGPKLAAMGVGSAYSVGELGTLQAGATQSEYRRSTAVRTRLGYSVNVGDAVDFGYVNEQIGAGYNDLADFRSGASAQNQVRNTFSAGVPLGNLGTFSGTYSGLRANSGYVERRFGVAHQVSLSPTVALGVGADRDTISGDYAMHMNLAMPVDAFLGRLGLTR